MRDKIAWSKGEEMLIKDFNELDKKYIAVKIRYLLENNREEYLNGVKTLAEEGQINALQDFFMNVKEHYALSPAVIRHITRFTQKLRRNFEENYYKKHTSNIEIHSTFRNVKCNKNQTYLLIDKKNDKYFIR